MPRVLTDALERSCARVCAALPDPDLRDLLETTPVGAPINTAAYRELLKRRATRPHTPLADALRRDPR